MTELKLKYDILNIDSARIAIRRFRKKPLLRALIDFILFKVWILYLLMFVVIVLMNHINAGISYGSILPGPIFITVMIFHIQCYKDAIIETKDIRIVRFRKKSNILIFDCMPDRRGISNRIFVDLPDSETERQAVFRLLESNKIRIDCVCKTAKTID